MALSQSTAPATLPLTDGHWVADLAHSGVVFSVRHLGLSKVRGRFDTFDISVDVDSSASVHVVADIDLASVDTNNPDRDAHLRSTDFFDVERHPTMRFEATEVRPVGADWELAGKVTLNGVTKPLAFRLEFNGYETFPATGALHAGFSAAGELKRSEFGIDFGIMPIGIDKLALADTVKFELDVQLLQPAVAPVS